MSATRLFTYGSLMLAEVMEIVTGRRLASRAAVLTGYERRALRDEVYPAIVPAPASRVRGVLWEGLDRTEVARLDRFESDIYERRPCEVEATGGERLAAEVYVLAPAHRARLLDRDWDEAAFRAHHLAAYLGACRELARAWSAPE